MDDVNETLARILDRTGQYRILRRVPAAATSAMSDEDRRRAGLAIGIVLDTETTGLGPQDEVIELGMAAFAYEPARLRIDHLVATFSALQQPVREIPAEVTRLTGISARDVAGRAIDAAEVASFVDGASLVVAHNAGFDRPVCERTWPLFAGLPWACSLRQVDWRAEGCEGARLGQILASRRLFHDGHRALDDCLALLHLLRQDLDFARTVFSAMMENAAAVGIRLWAVGAPYEEKGVLKARGYRWSDGSGGAPRAWHREVPEAEAAAELAFLRDRIYGDPVANPPRARITAHERFSARSEVPQERTARPIPRTILPKS